MARTLLSRGRIASSTPRGAEAELPGDHPGPVPERVPRICLLRGNADPAAPLHEERARVACLLPTCEALPHHDRMVFRTRGPAGYGNAAAP